MKSKYQSATLPSYCGQYSVRASWSDNDEKTTSGIRGKTSERKRVLHKRTYIRKYICYYVYVLYVCLSVSDPCWQADRQSVRQSTSSLCCHISQHDYQQQTTAETEWSRRIDFQNNEYACTLANRHRYIHTTYICRAHTYIHRYIYILTYVCLQIIVLMCLCTDIHTWMYRHTNGYMTAKTYNLMIAQQHKNEAQQNWTTEVATAAIAITTTTKVST